MMSNIYFLKHVDTGLIKIGVTADYHSRVPMRKVTRTRLKKFCNGYGKPYDTVINEILDDMEKKFNEDIEIAGQDYRRKKIEQAKKDKD